MERSLNVRVDADLLLAVKRRALETDVTVSEVVRRLLTLYTSGKINVPKREAPSE